LLYVGHFQLFWLNIQTNLPNSDIKIWSHWPPKITCSTLQKNAPRVVLSCTLKYFYRSFLNQSKYMDQMFNRISLESWCIRALSFHCCYLVSKVTLSSIYNHILTASWTQWRKSSKYFNFFQEATFKTRYPPHPPPLTLSNSVKMFVKFLVLLLGHAINIGNRDVSQL
jgi:hypothetical protein